MNKLSTISDRYSYFEKASYLILFILYCKGAIENIFLSLQVIPCLTTSDFLNLVENAWVASAWIGNIILTFMEYFYTVEHPIYLFLSCCSVANVIQFFATLIMVEQISEKKEVKFRIKALLCTFIVRAVALFLLLVMIVLTLNALSTGQAYHYLRIGAAFYGIGSFISLFPLVCGLFTLIKK